MIESSIFCSELLFEGIIYIIIHLPAACHHSSEVEHSFHKRVVRGSNPLGGTGFGRRISNCEYGMKNVKVLFTLSGIVQKHLRRGTKLGYPTANMKVYMNAPDGIFVGYVTLDSTRYQAIIFIGKPLTFDEYDKKAEVYILDFERDIYGTHIDVTVLEKLRDNQKFDSHELLIKQMQKDEIQAREFFSTINK